MAGWVAPESWAVVAGWVAPESSAVAVAAPGLRPAVGGQEAVGCVAWQLAPPLAVWIGGRCHSSAWTRGFAPASRAPSSVGLKLQRTKLLVISGFWDF